MLDREPRIQGMVVEISRREQKTKDDDGLEWERCVFTVALKQYSKGTPDLVLPQELEGKKVKISRYCAFDWHYRLNTRKTLSVYETRQILNGKTDLTERLMMSQKDEILNKLRTCIVDFDIDGVQEAARQAIQQNIPAYEAIMNGMSKGLEIVGDKFEAGEYFLSELIMAGETMKVGMKILRPYLKASSFQFTGKVVIGTVKGDIHDIGKNIVATLLESAGFEVDDLGTDVEASRFVEAVRKENADVVGLSALLTITMNYMKEVVNELKRVGLRDEVKVIIGGAPINEEFSRQIGADAYADDAVSGVEACKRIVGIS